MKERLKDYRRLMVEIEIEESRRAALDESDGYGAERARATIDVRLRKLREREEEEHKALAEIINALPTPEQRQVLFARYVDGHAWCGVARLLFGRKPDFWDKMDSYERRVYRIHGEALANANRIAEAWDKEKQGARRPELGTRRLRGLRAGKDATRVRGRGWRTLRGPEIKAKP